MYKNIDYLIMIKCNGLVDKYHFSDTVYLWQLSQ